MNANWSEINFEIDRLQAAVKSHSERKPMTLKQANFISKSIGGFVVKIEEN